MPEISHIIQKFNVLSDTKCVYLQLVLQYA